MSFSCNDVCCYLSVLSLPTCLILSDKHITGVSTETGPDVRLDRLPSQNDELTEDSAAEADKSDPQIVILDMLGSAVLLLALKENVYNLNVASHVSNQNCSDSLPILARPDAHFWVSKVNELLLLHSIWN